MPARKTLTCLLTGVAVALALPAQAQISCSLQVPAMSFGRIDILGALPVDRNLGSIEVLCTNTGGSDVAVPIRTSVSAGRSGNESARRMVGPGDSVLEYNLFRDAALTQLWRQTGDAPTAITVPANNQAALRLTVYGRLYGPKSAFVGEYTDTLVATVDY